MSKIMYVWSGFGCATSSARTSHRISQTENKSGFGCAAEFDNMADCGVTPAGTIDDPQWPKFSDFPCPPEYQPK